MWMVAAYWRTEYYAFIKYGPGELTKWLAVLTVS